MTVVTYAGTPIFAADPVGDPSEVFEPEFFETLVMASALKAEPPAVAMWLGENSADYELVPLETLVDGRRTFFGMAFLIPEKVVRDFARRRFG